MNFSFFLRKVRNRLLCHPVITFIIFSTALWGVFHTTCITFSTVLLGTYQTTLINFNTELWGVFQTRFINASTALCGVSDPVYHLQHSALGSVSDPVYHLQHGALGSVSDPVYHLQHSALGSVSDHVYHLQHSTLGSVSDPVYHLQHSALGVFQTRAQHDHFQPDDFVTERVLIVFVSVFLLLSIPCPVERPVIQGSAWPEARIPQFLCFSLNAGHPTTRSCVSCPCGLRVCCWCRCFQDNVPFFALCRKSLPS